jgi:hypothetical protein
MSTDVFQWSQTHVFICPETGNFSHQFTTTFSGQTAWLMSYGMNARPQPTNWVRRDSITKPSLKILLAETRGNTPGSIGGTGLGYGVYRPWLSNYLPAYRHADATHAAHFDGHVSAYKPGTDPDSAWLLP